MKCMNAIDGDEMNHQAGLAACDICGEESCASCREAVVGTKDRCLRCNEILPGLGVKGACGSGSCDI